MVKNNKPEKNGVSQVSAKSKDIKKSPTKATPKKQVEEVKNGVKAHQPKEMWDFFTLDKKYSK